MKSQKGSTQTDIVLIGGGQEGAIALQLWGIKPLEGVRLILISDKRAIAFLGAFTRH